MIKHRWTVAIASHEEEHYPMLSRCQSQPRPRSSLKTIVLLFLTIGCCCSLLTSAQESSGSSYAVSPAHSRLQTQQRPHDDRYSLSVPPPYSLSPSGSAVQPVYRQLPVPPPPPPQQPTHRPPPSNFRYFTSNVTHTNQQHLYEEEEVTSQWPRPRIQEESGLSVTTTGAVRSSSDSSQLPAVGSQLFDNPPLSEVGDLHPSPPNMDNVNTNHKESNSSSLAVQETIGDEYFDDYTNAGHQPEYVDGEEGLFPVLNSTNLQVESDVTSPQHQINVTITDPGFLTNVIHSKDDHQSSDQSHLSQSNASDVATATQNPITLQSVDNRLEPVGMPTSQHEVAVTPPTLPENEDRVQAETEVDQLAAGDYFISDYNETLSMDSNGGAAQEDTKYEYYDQGETGGVQGETAQHSQPETVAEEVSVMDSQHTEELFEEKMTTTTTTPSPSPQPAIGGSVSVVSYGDAEDGYHPSNHDDPLTDGISSVEVAEASHDETTSTTTETVTTTTTRPTTTEATTTKPRGYNFAPRTTPSLLPVPVTTTTTTTTTTMTTPTPPTTVAQVMTESFADMVVHEHEAQEEIHEQPEITTTTTSTTAKTTTTTTLKTSKPKIDMVANLTAFLDRLLFNDTGPFADVLMADVVNVTEKSIETTPKGKSDETEVTKNRSPLPSFKEISVHKPSYSQKQSSPTTSPSATTNENQTQSDEEATKRPSTTAATTTSKTSRNSTPRTRSRSGLSAIPTESIPMGLLPPGFSTEDPVTVLLVPLKSRGRKLSSNFDQLFEKHKNNQTTSSSSTVSTIKLFPELNSSDASIANVSDANNETTRAPAEPEETNPVIRKRLQNLSRKPFPFTRGGPPATRAPFKIATRKTSDILNKPRVTLRPVGRRINTNVHEGEYQSDPDSRTDSSATEGPPTTTTRRVVTTLSPYFLWGQSVEVASILKIEEGAEWSPALEDHRSSEYQELANEIEKQLDSLFKRSDFGNRYKGIQIEGFSKGSVIVDYTLYLTESDEPIETSLLWEAISKALENGTNMGSFMVDPGTLSFEVIRKITPPPEVTTDGLLLPHWAIAVIVIAAASFLFLIILCLALTRNKRGAKRKLYGNVLQEDSITERAKNWDKSTYDNLGAASSIYDTNDTWDEKKLKQQQKNFNYNLYSVNPPSTGYYNGQKHSYHGGSLNKLDREQYQQSSNEHHRHSTGGGTTPNHYPPSHHNNPDDPYGRYYDSWRSEWSRITSGSRYKPPDYDTTF